MGKDPRDVAIEQKTSEMKQNLENWIRTSLILHPGEFVNLDIRLQIAERPIVEMNVSTRSRKTVNTEEALKEDDWEKILSVPLPKKLRGIVEIIHENNNEPMLPSEIVKILYEQKEYRSKGNEEYIYEADKNILNSHFKRYGYLYRLKVIAHRAGSHWNEYPLKIYIVES